MKVMYRCGKDSLAVVYLADFGDGRYLEFVEAVEPPKPRGEKWVIIISTMFGCPVGCAFCDAGGDYRGRCSEEEVFEQIDYLVRLRFPELEVGAEKFKLQFARMGEPALNPAVLSVLRELPRRYFAPGLMPALSTIAPRGSEEFFEELLRINHEIYGGRFQLQFSLHTTDATLRDRLIPAKKMDFRWIADYGRRFFVPGGRKVTLNFALAEGALLAGDQAAAGRNEPRHDGQQDQQANEPHRPALHLDTPPVARRSCATAVLYSASARPSKATWNALLSQGRRTGKNSRVWAARARSHRVRCGLALSARKTSTLTRFAMRSANSSATCACPPFDGTGSLPSATSRPNESMPLAYSVHGRGRS